MHGYSPKTIVLTSSAMLLGGTAAAQEHAHEPADPAAQTSEASAPPAEHDPPPQDATDPDPPLPDGVTLDQMLDSAEGPPPDSWPEPIHDNPILSFTLFELLEYRVSDNARDQFGWDAQGWIGNDNHKFWWKTEGTAVFDGPDEGEADFQALYARPLSAFWFVQAGVRYDQFWTPGDSRGRFSGVLGVQGLAPYKFDLEPALFLTEDADLHAELTASYDLYMTQRLVLQPRLEFSLSAQDVPEFGLGAGFNDIALGLRLRYEIGREFAPYFGVQYTTLLGETADIARSAGEGVDDLQLVFGVRIAF